MNIMFTKVSVTYACEELGYALKHLIPDIKRTAISVSQEIKNDDRNLIIVLCCPCCFHDPLLDTKNTIFVSPFKGIAREGYKIKLMSQYPPFRNPGHNREASNIEEFLESFRSTIKKALD